jgi:hypothetical protein
MFVAMTVALPLPPPLPLGETSVANSFGFPPHATVTWR